MNIFWTHFPHKKGSRHLCKPPHCGFFSYFPLTFFSILVHILLLLGKGWESNGFFPLIHFLHFVWRQMWRQTAKRNQSWQPYGLSAYSSFAKLVIVWWSFSVKLKPIEKLNWGMNSVWQIQNLQDVMWELFLDLSWYNNDCRLIPKHVLSISVQKKYIWCEKVNLISVRTICRFYLQLFSFIWYYGSVLGPPRDPRQNRAGITDNCYYFISLNKCDIEWSCLLIFANWMQRTLKAT